MSQQLKRVAFAFARGALTAFGLLVFEHYADITKSVQVRDFASLKTIGLALLGGVISGGIRAAEAYIKGVPSAEPEENA